LCVPMYAEDVNHDGFTSILVPIVSDVPISGGKGGIWRSQLWLHTDVAMRFVGCGFSLPPVPCPTHVAGATEQAFDSEKANTVGALVYQLPNEVAAQVSLSARLFEDSVQEQPAGVDIPVIREGSFFTGPVRFVGIPQSNSARVALRLYDPRRTGGLNVRVDFFVPGAAQPIRSTTLALDYSHITSFGEPGYAAVFDVAAAFPELNGTDRFDIRITPVPAGSEYFGLVSVTDNQTQQILLITAQEPR